MGALAEEEDRTRTSRSLNSSLEPAAAWSGVDDTCVGRRKGPTRVGENAIREGAGEIEPLIVFVCSARNQ